MTSPLKITILMLGNNANYYMSVGIQKKSYFTFQSLHDLHVRTLTKLRHAYGQAVGMLV